MREMKVFPVTRQGVRNLDAVRGRYLPISGGPLSFETNVGSAERMACTLAGGMLGVLGLSRGGLKGLGLAIVGGALVNRGLTGHCPLYDALGVNTANRRSHSNAKLAYRLP